MLVAVPNLFHSSPVFPDFLGPRAPLDFLSAFPQEQRKHSSTPPRIVGVYTGICVMSFRTLNLEAGSAELRTFPLDPHFKPAPPLDLKGTKDLSRSERFPWERGSLLTQCPGAYSSLHPLFFMTAAVYFFFHLYEMLSSSAVSLFHGQVFPASLASPPSSGSLRPFIPLFFTVAMLVYSFSSDCL